MLLNYSHLNQHIELKSEIKDVLNQAPQWCLTISDKGMGIATEELLHIFERNYRTASARKLRPEESIISLPLAVVLARAHYGLIGVKSQPNIITNQWLNVLISRYLFN